jgi:thiol:disulfide interchange protein
MSAQRLKWEQSLAAAQARAKAEKKLILLGPWAEWCGPCQALRQNVFPSAKAQDRSSI